MSTWTYNTVGGPSLTVRAIFTLDWLYIWVRTLETRRTL